jgi:hypothetical protein
MNKLINSTPNKLLAIGAVVAVVIIIDGGTIKIDGGTLKID